MLFIGKHEGVDQNPSISPRNIPISNGWFQHWPWHIFWWLNHHVSVMYQLPSGKLTVRYWKWWFIVDLAIKNGDFPVRYVGLPEGKTHFPQFCAGGVINHQGLVYHECSSPKIYGTSSMFINNLNGNWKSTHIYILYINPPKTICLKIPWQK